MKETPSAVAPFVFVPFPLPFALPFVASLNFKPKWFTTTATTHNRTYLKRKSSKKRNAPAFPRLVEQRRTSYVVQFVLVDADKARMNFFITQPKSPREEAIGVRKLEKKS